MQVGLGVLTYDATGVHRTFGGIVFCRVTKPGTGITEELPLAIQEMTFGSGSGNMRTEVLL